MSEKIYIRALKHSLDRLLSGIFHIFEATIPVHVTIFFV